MRSGNRSSRRMGQKSGQEAERTGIGNQQYRRSDISSSALFHKIPGLAGINQGFSLPGQRTPTFIAQNCRGTYDPKTETVRAMPGKGRVVLHS